MNELSLIEQARQEHAKVHRGMVVVNGVTYFAPTLEQFDGQIVQVVQNDGIISLFYNEKLICSTHEIEWSRTLVIG